MRKITTLGVLSDIHNDTIGLRSALAVLKHCDKIIHLGDLVEDSFEGNSIVDLLVANQVEGVVGYHDETALKISNCFTEDTKGYLLNLPKEISRGDFHFVHDNPLSKEKNEGLYHYGGYIKDEYSARKVFEESSQKVLFVGHTHRAVQYEFDGESIRHIKEDLILLNPAKRYILNPGPVCMQQRGTAPSVGLFDFERNLFSIRTI